LKIGFKSDRGVVKKHNEDSLLVDESLGLFVVADGMGGHKAGEIASHIAVDRIASHVRAGLEENIGPSEILAAAMVRTSRAIFETAQTDPWWNDMGTTAVVALLNGERIVICHVGDSRAYLIDQTSIQRLTQDHTFVAEWLRAGTITPEEARTHTARHGLTMALGVEDTVEPDVDEWRWQDGHSLLLCSDGLTDVLEDHEIMGTVASIDDPQQACEALVSQANKRGGPDNITVVLVKR
jgi:protein phosphatase